jgi:hypothetical protein
VAPQVYVTSIFHHEAVLIVPARYAFAKRDPMTDVILAATTLHLILGSTFAALYDLIFESDWGAFISATGGVVDRQWRLSDSFVTPTTLGYRDVLPSAMSPNPSRPSMPSPARPKPSCCSVASSARTRPSPEVPSTRS